MHGRKHLLIPDAHAKPNESLERFRWLGELILEEKPDVIIDIGDWWDMESLCSYDKGTKSFEGRRYKSDVESGHKADALCFGAILRYNNTRTKSKKAHYNPTILRTTGNHEYRIHKAIERQPELDGAISMSDLHPRIDLDISVAPFLSPRCVDGIMYSHYFVSGIMGRPVSTARALVAKHHMSCTMGHAHSRDWAEGVRADGVRMQGLICGSFHDPDHNSSYAGPGQALWWDGVHIKNNVTNGDYDRTEISIQRLKERYS